MTQHSQLLFDQSASTPTTRAHRLKIQDKKSISLRHLPQDGESSSPVTAHPPPVSVQLILSLSNPTGSARLLPPSSLSFFLETFIFPAQKGPTARVKYASKDSEKNVSIHPRGTPSVVPWMVRRNAAARRHAFISFLLSIFISLTLALFSFLLEPLLFPAITWRRGPTRILRLWTMDGARF